jgi:hypothetical protein
MTHIWAASYPETVTSHQELKVNAGSVVPCPFGFILFFYNDIKVTDCMTHMGCIISGNSDVTPGTKSKGCLFCFTLSIWIYIVFYNANKVTCTDCMTHMDCIISCNSDVTTGTKTKACLFCCTLSS